MENLKSVFLKEYNDYYDEEVEESEYVVSNIFQKYGLDFPYTKYYHIGDDTISHVKSFWFHHKSFEDKINELAEMVKEIETYYKEGGTVYRFLFIDNPEDFDEERLGEHWTSNPDIVDDYDIMYKVTNDSDDDLYKKKFLIEITATVPRKTIDPEESFGQRESYPEERELVIKDTESMDVQKVNVIDNPYYEGE